MGGVKVLHMNIDCLCPWETIQKICDVLREDINKLGDGIDFEITVLDSYNKSEVLTQCINELKNFFVIDKWSFNQTINLSEIELTIANVEGVSSVPKLEISNKCTGRYSPNSYNIMAATKDKIVYPSLDPCVFEIKFPNSDIKGRAR